MNSLQKIGLNQISSTGNSKQNSRIEAVGGLPLKAKAWKNIPPNACKSKHKLSIIQTTLKILIIRPICCSSHYKSLIELNIHFLNHFFKYVPKKTNHAHTGCLKIISSFYFHILWGTLYINLIS